MAAYALIAGGVIRLDDNAHVPDRPENADWQLYQRWLTEGGVPRPVQPSPVHVWNGAAWVIDAALELKATAVSQLATDIAAIKLDAPTIAFLKMTPAQIDSYVDTNFPGAAAPMPNLRVVLKIMGKTLAALGRREIAGIG